MKDEFEDRVDSFLTEKNTILMPKAPSKVKNRIDKLRNILLNNPLPSGNTPQLWVNSPNVASWFALAKSITVGANPDNDLQILDDLVSGNHLKIVEDTGAWAVEDLDSTNGVYLNGEKTQQCRLKDGDIVQIGDSWFIFVLPLAI